MILETVILIISLLIFGFLIAAVWIWGDRLTFFSNNRNNKIILTVVFAILMILSVISMILNFKVIR